MRQNTNVSSQNWTHGRGKRVQKNDANFRPMSGFSRPTANITYLRTPSEQQKDGKRAGETERWEAKRPGTNRLLTGWFQELILVCRLYKFRFRVLSQKNIEKARASKACLLSRRQRLAHNEHNAPTPSLLPPSRNGRFNPSFLAIARGRSDSIPRRGRCCFHRCRSAACRQR